MFQFELPAPLLQFRLNDPAFVPLFTFPPEITTDRACIYSLYIYSYFLLSTLGSWHVMIKFPLPGVITGEKSPDPP